MRIFNKKGKECICDSAQLPTLKAAGWTLGKVVEATIEMPEKVVEMPEKVVEMPEKISNVSKKTIPSKKK